MHKLLNVMGNMPYLWLPRNCAILSDQNGVVAHGWVRSLSNYVDGFATHPTEDSAEAPSDTQKNEEAGKDDEKSVHTVEGIMLHIRQPYKLHGLQSGPANCVYMTRQRVKDLYTQMQTIRYMENAAESLQKARIISKFCRAQTGNEACAVGMRAAMRNYDKIISNRNSFGWDYLMGVTPGRIFDDAASKPRFQPNESELLNIYAKNFFGSNGQPCSHISLGGGLAFASKFAGDNSACLTIYEPGIANNAQVFETFNMAALWKLPCVFVCHNNGAIATEGNSSSSEQKSSQSKYIEHYTRGHYMPGIWLDGRDMLAVLSATKFAINYVLENGPIILEMNTSPGVYRFDPIQNFRHTCAECGLLSDEEANGIDRTVNMDIFKAMTAVQKDYEVKDKSSEFIASTYAKPLEPNIRGINYLEIINKNLQVQVKN